MEKAAGAATLRDVFTSLFSKKALNDGTWYVMLSDIMAQPEMRPFLACHVALFSSSMRFSVTS